MNTESVWGGMWGYGGRCVDCGSQKQFVHNLVDDPPLVISVCAHCDWIGECGPYDRQPPTITAEQWRQEYEADEAERQR